MSTVVFFSNWKPPNGFRGSFVALWKQKSKQCQVDLQNTGYLLHSFLCPFSMFGRPRRGKKLTPKSTETCSAVAVLHFVFTEKINDTDFFLAKGESEVRKGEISWGESCFLQATPQQVKPLLGPDTKQPEMVKRDWQWEAALGCSQGTQTSPALPRCCSTQGL